MDLEKEMEKVFITNTPRASDKPGSRERITTEAILSDRAKTHGDYKQHAMITQHFKDYVRNLHEIKPMSDTPVCIVETLSAIQLESLDMIFHKIGRILAGDPDFRDHWDDIAGYAKLVADRCSK